VRWGLEDNYVQGVYEITIWLGFDGAQGMNFLFCISWKRALFGLDMVECYSVEYEQLCVRNPTGRPAKTPY